MYPFRFESSLFFETSGWVRAGSIFINEHTSYREEKRKIHMISRRHLGNVGKTSRIRAPHGYATRPMWIWAIGAGPYGFDKGNILNTIGLQWWSPWTVWYPRSTVLLPFVSHLLSSLICDIIPYILIGAGFVYSTFDVNLRPTWASLLYPMGANSISWYRTLR